ncbi:Uncharacterised protein [Streptococcus constellatus]|uniref:Uncharacterized protein n=1 Tax=Streptococcus constellatus TaxID=76860 RepID=A0A564T1L3_STRCV|nr:hypothetical protein [Streptococcus constellatus]VUX01250.1 Uncharacterised protein [Streptococcus constellatus]VUX03461.1 Uncharacterised protein [Streptococcus gordonii]
MIQLTRKEKEFLQKYTNRNYHRFRDLEYYALLLQKMKNVSESS